jgi:hypothetical protein
MRASFDELVRLAALTRSASEDDLRELDRELDELDDADITLLFFALAAGRGRAFRLTTNVPERYHKFIAHLDAHLEEVATWRPGFRQFVFHPPAVQ